MRLSTAEKKYLVSPMAKHEHEFMTGQGQGPKGAAYNQVYEFCKEFGWFMGLSDHGEPILTTKGTEAVRAYQANENNSRIDVI
jgi:hypothetical protein